MSTPSHGGSHALFDDNDSFWDTYNSLGESYRKQLDPLLQYNYKLGIWDRIGNFLDFNTKEDAYRMQLQQEARLKAVSLAGDEFQNNYNSAAEKSARERAAGLNPDLTGTEAGAPASGEEQPVQPFGLDTLQPVSGPIDLPSLFGMATSGLQSVVTFGKVMSEITNLKNIGAGQEIDNLDKAMRTLRPIATALNPNGISTILKNDMTPEEIMGSEDIQEVYTSALSKQFSEYSPEAQKYLKRAWNSLRNDPSVWAEWYRNVSSAVEARADSIVKESTLGAYDVAKEVIEASNNVNINQMINRVNITYALHSKLAELSKITADNEIEYQEFLKKNGLPSELARSQAQQYLVQIAEAEYQKERINAQRAWLKELLGLKDKYPNNDNIPWLINGVINGSYAPLMQSSFNSKFGPAGLSLGGSQQSVPGLPNLTAGDDSGVTGLGAPSQPLTPEEQVQNYYNRSGKLGF